MQQSPSERIENPHGSYKWWVVVMLWFVCLFNYADRQAIFSVFPLLKSEMGLTDQQLGYVASSFMWVYALSAPFAGAIGDRFSRKSIILGGLIFWSVVTVATALSTQYWHLLLFRALEGLGEAFYFPASMSLLSDYHSRDTRSRANSWHQSSVYAGTIAGGSVAGLLAEHLGWRSGFWLFGSLGIVLGLILIFLLREPVRGSADGEVHGHGSIQWKDIRSGVFSHPMVPILMAVFIGANFVAMVFLTWMPSYLSRTFSMSLSMAGFSATAYLQMASVAGVLAGGVIADRLAQKRAGGRMLTQAAGLLAGVPFVFLTGWTLQIPILILAMAGFGFFKGFYDANIWASLHDVVKVERRATAVGLMNSLGWLGGGAAPIAVAAASAHIGMSACLSANALIYLAFGCLMLWGVARFMAPGRPQIGHIPATVVKGM